MLASLSSTTSTSTILSSSRLPLGCPPSSRAWREYQSIAETIGAIQKGTTTPRSLLEDSLVQVEANKDLNAFISVRSSESLDADLQSLSSQEQARSDSQLLHGIPIAVKDNFCLEGTVSSAGSKLLADFVSPYSAHVCEKLKEHGALVVGKTNLDEFGMGSMGVHSYYGPAVHPSSPPEKKLSPGGSSSGSAVAVASGQVFGALGSDTGGSVRLPAAWCNIVGLKPSYGLCSRFGLIAYASSLDCPALFSRSVEDSARILSVVAGHDSRDSTSVNQAPINYLQTLLDTPLKDMKGVVVGIPVEYNVKELPEQSRKAWEEAIAYLESLGATVKSVSLPHTPQALAAYYVIAPSEASSNLARYDGLRYGLQESEPDDNTRTRYTRTRSDGFGKEVQKRILLGTHMLSNEAYEANYVQAMKIRRLVQQDFAKVFKEVDVLLTPTATTLPQPIDEVPENEYSNDVMTVPSSLAGIPAVSVPAKKYPGSGIQVITNRLEESLLFRVARDLETLGEP
eukprot:TRINITY_DN5568_c0_g1_i1.p1 TRINITY_DN5568_c0_g1~~TRINITY_DN5568_c0_g1_i1.p1  ORF type:complete len:511 (-),score=114.50 TRINITY_DN5568_c0_g1_i1:225-1757(-)